MIDLFNISSNSSCYGIQVGTNSDNNSFDRILIENISGSNWAAGLYVTSSDNVDFYNSMILNVSSGTSSYGIYALSSLGFNFSNNMINASDCGMRLNLEYIAYNIDSESLSFDETTNNLSKGQLYKGVAEEMKNKTDKI